MTLPAEAVAQGRRAPASCVGCEGGKRDQELAPRRLDRDRWLVEALRLAGPTAAEDLVASYGGRAYRLAIGITGNQRDAEEVVQDALWKVVRKIDTFTGDSPFGSWLYRIVANAAYDKLRSRRGQRGDCSLDELSAMVDEHGEAVVDWSSQAEDPALQTELRIVLTAAIESLPEDYRTVVVLRDVEGLSMHEIAETTGLSVASVKVRAHRARLMLRKRLGAYLSGPPMRVTACERTGEETPIALRCQGPGLKQARRAPRVTWALQRLSAWCSRDHDPSAAPLGSGPAIPQPGPQRGAVGVHVNAPLHFVDAERRAAL